MNVSRSKIIDPFYQQLNETLADFEVRLAHALPFASRTERNDIVRLVAGISVLMQLAAGHVPDIRQLNAVLAARLGNGYSWLACLQFLAGARARDTFVKREAILATLVDPAFLVFAAASLPTMPQTLSVLMAPTQGAQSAIATRARSSKTSESDSAA